MRLVVGLGNPGERYRRTRHNVGFMVADVLAHRAQVTGGSVQADAWTAETSLAGVPVLLVKPLTFMNRSGLAVEQLMRGHQAKPSEMLVVVDDIALSLGVLRLRERGGHGGHNGLRSIIESLDTDDFPRLRVGVRRGEVGEDLADYVLADFADEDVLVVHEAVGRAADAIECVLSEGIVAAMNRFNRTELD
jgi:PTH1 family peptidyl-tRNA hydrolase